MKAILVIDMPSSCSMCKADKICKVWNEEQIKFKGYNDRLDACPLKPMPEKLEDGYGEKYRRAVYWHYEDGWNECIDEILGETE